MHCPTGVLVTPFPGHCPHLQVTTDLPDMPFTFSGILLVLCFCVCLASSLSIVVLRFMSYVVRMMFIPALPCCPFSVTDQTLLIHSPVVDCGYFQFFNVINGAAANACHKSLSG